MSERAPRRYTDGSVTFDGGIDAGVMPSEVDKNQVAFESMPTSARVSYRLAPVLFRRTTTSVSQSPLITPRLPLTKRT